MYGFTFFRIISGNLPYYFFAINVIMRIVASVGISLASVGTFHASMEHLTRQSEHLMRRWNISRVSQSISCVSWGNLMRQTGHFMGHGRVMKDQIVEWAKELQSLAQAGLFYGHDVYDRERYQRIRDIAAQMMALRTDIPVEKIQDLFCGEVGYQTPKVDTRAVLFKDHKILLVRENDGRWSIPGGWCEFNMSPADNAVKEMKEEAGLDVTIKSVISVQDRDKHNPPPL